jgi:hypothetical protein
MRHTPFIRIFYPVALFLTGIFVLFSKQEIGYYLFRSEVGSVIAAFAGFMMTWQASVMPCCGISEAGLPLGYILL